MKGPIRLIRSNEIQGMENLGSIYQWSEGTAYLVFDKVVFRETPGVVSCYYNPPVHQVGNPGLDAYLEGLNEVFQSRNDLAFILFCGANDPVHAGGDLKESLSNLDKTIEMRKGMEAEGASPEDIDLLYEWADKRIKKGIALHAGVRKLAEHMRVIAVCGGGTRFGGSAEIPLMADFLVGDSRSGMCFSEAMIGLIPGWSGVARSFIKAGPINAEYMAKTSTEVKARQLEQAGIYNITVEIPFNFPRRQKTGDAESDKANYLEDLESHDHDTGMLLIPKGLELATCPIEEIPVIDESRRTMLAAKEEISLEVKRRCDPETYRGLWGKPLKEVNDEIKKLGRPLAPQSINALNRLFSGFGGSSFDENTFVGKEAEMDSELYRDARFRSGLIATLEQRVANFMEV